MSPSGKYVPLSYFRVTRSGIPFILGSNRDIILVNTTARAARCVRQDGPYSGYSRFSACTALGDGSVILGGLTEGNWSGTNQGGYDFAVVKLNASGHEEWRLQVISECRPKLEYWKLRVGLEH